jgi:hypothetical protein
VTGSSYQLGGNLFAFGSCANAIAFLGFSGNTTNTGVDNTASGSYALNANTTGNDNTASGSAALYWNTTGYLNTASGSNALSSNTTGSGNTASGAGALPYNTTGNFNTALGYNAGPGNFTNLTNATAIGANAVVSESNALVLGCIMGGPSCAAGTNIGIGTATPVAAILDVQGGLIHDGGGGYFPVSAEGAYLGWNGMGGYGETDFFNNEGLGSGGWWFINTASTGSYSGYSLYIDSSGSLHSSSSRRWKTNIHTLRDALAQVQQLRGVSYDRKDSGKHEIGVIAEEVGAVVPEVVSWEKNGTDAQGVDYGRLTALLIEATKQQQKLIQQQQEQIQVQEAQMKVQQARLDRLTRQVRAVQAAIKADGRANPEVRSVKAEVSVLPR